METDDDVPGGGHRRLKRSSAPASQHSWVLLNRTCARPKDFHAADRTTSATSRTSRGDEISVSFQFLEPPNTSFLILTADLPPGSVTIIAAHRDVVLLAMTWSYDLFVYQASRLPSLLLLPSAGRPVIYSHRMDTWNEDLGIMSCTSNDDDNDDSSPPFVVAHLQMRSDGAAATADAHLFRSGSGQWEAFENLQVHGANDRRESESLCWWRTDEVVRYGRRYMIWVDYFRGLVIMDLWSQLSETTNPPPPPRLRYVRLPVDQVGDPDDPESDDRGCPEASRSVCVTRYGIKFISIDNQHTSNFGIGESHTRTWSYRFRITTWSLCEDDYTWRNDMTMHEEKFWDTFDGGARFPFPHVQPQFPVVDADNPDIVVFQLAGEHRSSRQKWMIEVDMRKNVLLAATDYSKKKSDDNADDINLVTWKSGFDPIPTELPRYLDGEEACKKRRQ